jgi:hypothetical protein
MTSFEVDVAEPWASPSCTLPTVERPLRLAEFDRLFNEAVRAANRCSPTQLRLQLEPTAELAAQAADLVVRETACCSFFTFILTATGGALELTVGVPASHVEVLDGLADLVGEVRT